MVNKVPGSLSIAAHSKHHTIAASLINTTHSIHHFSFGDLPPKRRYVFLKYFGYHLWCTLLSGTLKSYIHLFMDTFFISFLFFLFFSYGILKGASIAANRLKNTYWTTKGANHTHEHYIKVVNVVYSGSTEYTAYKYTVNSHEYQDDINYAGAVLCFASFCIFVHPYYLYSQSYITYIKSWYSFLFFLFNTPGAKFTFDLSPMTIVMTTQTIPFYHFVTSLCAIVGGVFTVVGMFDSALFATWNAVAKKNAMGKLI